MKPSQRRKEAYWEQTAEFRRFNGHVQRLWTQKAKIDNKTPRSLYTNPRSSHYKSINGRSRSTDPLSRSLPIVQNGLSPTNVSPNRADSAAANLQMHRRVSPLSSNTQPASSTAAASPTYGQSLRYERRGLDGDLIERNSYRFSQPRRHFTPRTLLTNFTESRVAKLRTYRAPPGRRHPLQAQNGHAAIYEDDFEADLGFGDGESTPDSLLAGGAAAEVGGRDGRRSAMSRGRQKSPARLTSDSSKSVLSVAVSRATSKSPVRQQLDAQEDELRYYEFVQELTRDVVDRGVYSDRVLKNIIAYHIEQKKHVLNMDKMRLLVYKLLDDLGVTHEGLLSTFADAAEHPETVHFDTSHHSDSRRSRRKLWTPPRELLSHSDPNQTRQPAPKHKPSITVRRPADTGGSIDASLSLNDSDVERILAGGDLKELAARARRRSKLEKRVDSGSESSKGSEQLAAGRDGDDSDERTIGDDVSELEEDGSASAGGHSDSGSNDSVYASEASNESGSVAKHESVGSAQSGSAASGNGSVSKHESLGSVQSSGVASRNGTNRKASSNQTQQNGEQRRERSISASSKSSYDLAAKPPNFESDVDFSLNDKQVRRTIKRESLNRPSYEKSVEQASSDERLIEEHSRATAVLGGEETPAQLDQPSAQTQELPQNNNAQSTSPSASNHEDSSGGGGNSEIDAPLPASPRAASVKSDTEDELEESEALDLVGSDNGSDEAAEEIEEEFARPTTALGGELGGDEADVVNSGASSAHSALSDGDSQATAEEVRQKRQLFLQRLQQDSETLPNLSPMAAPNDANNSTATVAEIDDALSSSRDSDAFDGLSPIMEVPETPLHDSVFRLPSVEVSQHLNLDEEASGKVSPSLSVASSASRRSLTRQARTDMPDDDAQSD